MVRPADAHPMGNFSISHYAAIRIERDFVELRYLLDMAEIPTFQEMQRTGIVAEVGDPRVAAYLAQQAEAFQQGLVLELSGRRLSLQWISDDVLFPPGAGNLPTMKLGVVYRAALSGIATGGTASLDYQDLNFPERAGWKEVVATAGQGIIVTGSTVPETDRSAQLSNYPTDLINSPPQVLEARLTFQEAELVGAVGNGPGAMGRKRNAAGNRSGRGLATAGRRADKQPAPGIDVAGTGISGRTIIQNPKSKIADRPGPLGLRPNQQGTPRNAFTDLVAAKQFGLWFLVVAAAIAAGLGALHALEPGHGKTIVAAYLVGSRGTAAHACLLGLIVTASHTAGVYLLGAITLYASRYVVPDRLYPWLSVISGLTIAGVGLYLFLLRRRGDGYGHAHPHVHAHDHPHVHHHDHDHVHSHSHSHSHSHTHLHAHESEAHGKAHAHLVMGDTHDEVAHSHEVVFAGEDNGVTDHSHSHVPRSGSISYRELLVLGITGGMVPCPAALVVLLSAVTVHRIGFGLFLIVAFSVGLAAVLIGIGLLTVCAGRFMSRFKMEGPLVRRWLPMTSAAVITLLGLGITAKAMAAADILRL